jgi:hypothetical protein
VARSIADILADLDRFPPPDDALRGWQPFAELVAELGRAGGLPDAAPRVFGYFERHPTVRVRSWLWDVVHALEWHPGKYEAAAVESLGRRPSDFAARVLGRAARPDTPPELAPVLRQGLELATAPDAEPLDGLNNQEKKHP